MSKLAPSAVVNIARSVAREQSVPLDVVGVVRAGSDSSYVEILVNVEKYTNEPGRLTIGVFRDASEAALQRAIAAQLHRHLDATP